MANSELLEAGEAAAFFDDLQARGSAILGIDAFVRKDGKVVPSLDLLIDCSADTPAKAKRRCKEFIAEAGDGILFEIWFAD
ncbi:MAG TPA: hypothetical protein VK485_01590 [Sphingomicrobium sp.]|nr:hypothetical protein [Sphingomicrobium sp.]